MPAQAMTIPTTTTRKSSSSTPSDRNTTPSDGKRVEPGERWREERGNRPDKGQEPEGDVAGAMVEEEAQAGPGEAFEPTDQLHQPGEELLLLVAGELELAPPVRQPDLVPVGDQLERQQHRDDLEHVRGATGRQRERGHAEEQDEQHREALLAEQIDEAPDRFLAVAGQPALELVTDLLRRRVLGIGRASVSGG